MKMIDKLTVWILILFLGIAGGYAWRMKQEATQRGLAVPCHVEIRHLPGQNKDIMYRGMAYVYGHPAAGNFKIWLE